VWEGRARWRAPPSFCTSLLGAGLLRFSGFEGADGFAVCSGAAADGVFDPGGEVACVEVYVEDVEVLSGGVAAGFLAE